MADKKEYKELEREALLSILLETEKLAEVGGWEWDIKKDVWTFSDNWLLIHGCTTRHLSTSDLLPIAHPDDRADIQRAFDKALVEGAKYEIEHRIIRQDTGEERYVRALGRPKLDEDGKPVKLFGSAQDITESKKVDKTLRESEEKFRHLFDNSPTGKTITYVSGELQSNAAFAQMLGYSQDEFQNFAWQDITHPDDMDLSQNTIESLLSGRKESDRFTKRYIHKNGSIVWADVSTRVQRDSKGNPLYFITAVIDITEMKKAEKALQEANERFKLTESIANVGSWQWDIQTDHVQWSEELFRIFGRDPSSGAPSYADHGEIYVDEDMQRLDGAVKACVSMGKQYELVLQAIRADGEIRHCVARGQAQKNDDGKVVRIVGSFQDITERKQAEAALRESEQEFKNITENIPGLVLKYKLHPDGTDELIYLSKGVKDLYEVSREDALNNVQLLWERIHKDDLDDYVLSIQKSSETMTLWEKEHRISLPDGKIKWIQARGTPNKQSDGSIIWNTIGIDITDHKRAEEERRKSDERFRVAQEMSPDGFTIFRPVRNDQNQIIDFTWVYENEAVAKMNGTDPQEVVGQRLLELFPGHKGTQFFNSYKEVAETGKPITFEEGYVGETIKKKTWFRIVVVPMAENIAILNHDITERKLIEENLANTFNLSPSIIAKANLRTGFYIEANQAVTRILGYSIEEFTSKPIKDFIHPDDKEATIEAMSQQLDGKDVLIENRFLSKNGSYKWISWNANSANDEGIVLGLGSDITERKKLHEQLNQSRKMESIGNLAGGIAHEFNNILSIIIGNNELIMEELPKYSLGLESAEEIRLAGIRARDVVRQLLTFSRQDNTEKTTLNILSVVEESIKLIRSSTPTNIDIQKNLSDGVLPVFGNATQINQILINLRNNAVDAMPTSGGILAFDLSHEEFDKERQFLPPGQYVKMMVRDNGTGIDPDTLDKIFDPYFTTKQVGKGTGIGLAIVHGIVKQHNGHIIAESQIGKGTTFTVYFPLHDSLPETESEENDHPVGKERILYVDDEPAIAKLGKRHLESLGYTVKSTTDPLDALEIIKNKPDAFDLLISDMAMPRMTGDELISEVLKIRPDMATIICTGYSAKISEKEATRIGVGSFVMKPLNKSELAQTIRNVLGDIEGEDSS